MTCVLGADFVSIYVHLSPPYLIRLIMLATESVKLPLQKDGWEKQLIAATI
jgi:hypothetical protein